MANYMGYTEQGDQPPRVTSPQLRALFKSLESLRIDKARIQPLETECERMGGNADVVRAELKPAEPLMSSSPPEIQYVAVKKFRTGDNINDTRVLAFLAHEVYLLNELPHNNIVKIVGFVEDTNAGIAWMILPWEKNGNLREFVRSAEWECPERLALPGTAHLSWGSKLANRDILRLRQLGEQYSKVEGFYIISRNAFVQAGNQLGLANAVNGLGRLYAEHKDSTKAEQSYREAQEIFATIGDKYFLANSLWAMGSLRQSQCRYDEAESLVSEASTLYKEVGFEKDGLQCDGFLEKAKIGIERKE
ncbi:hypothetical protein FRC04_001583 [Tulasnella sp. 424]|nr:hypothetical protein FRC04_001583 [Tulasnella sp. 424]